MRTLCLATALALAAPALAQDAVTPAPAAPAPAASSRPPMFLALTGGSTLAFRPSGGTLLGPQKDLVPSVGFGVGVSEAVFLELDLTATYLDGDLGPAALVPGVNWFLTSSLFAAGRVSVPLVSGTRPSLLAGLGLSLPVGPHFAPVVEADVFVTPHALRRADVGLALSVGTTYSF